MAKYDINGPGVKKTLNATAKKAGQFDDVLKPMGDHVTSAATACDSGAIGPALEGLFKHEQTELKAMTTQIEACLTGAAAATAAYLNGDLEMMLTYQKNAKDAKITKMPKKYR